MPVGDRLGAALKVELGQDIGDMTFDCVQAETQRTRDEFVALAVS